MMIDWKPALKTAAFSTTAGVKSVQFLLSSDFNGTIGGVAFLGSAWSVIPAEASMGNSLGPINVTISAGNVIPIYSN